MNFIKTIIPTDSFQQVTTMGNKYIVNIDANDLNDGTTECYQCMVYNEPDIEALEAELETWKSHRHLRAATIGRQIRMKEILAQLAATDYLALKAFEGEDMSEHPTWKEDRASLRAEYRQLETANLALSVIPQQ
jgi:hypothetical protein